MNVLLDKEERIEELERMRILEKNRIESKGERGGDMVNGINGLDDEKCMELIKMSEELDEVEWEGGGGEIGSEENRRRKGIIGKIGIDRLDGRRSGWWGWGKRRGWEGRNKGGRGMKSKIERKEDEKIEMIEIDVGEVGLIEDIRKIENSLIVDERIFDGNIRKI